MNDSLVYLQYSKFINISGMVTQIFWQLWFQWAALSDGFRALSYAYFYGTTKLVVPLYLIRLYRHGQYQGMEKWILLFLSFQLTSPSHGFGVLFVSARIFSVCRMVFFTSHSAALQLKQHICLPSVIFFLEIPLRRQRNLRTDLQKGMKVTMK